MNFQRDLLTHVAAFAHGRYCDGFRMPAPPLSLQHARRLPGRRTKAASEGNRGRRAPLSAGAMGFWFPGPVQRRSRNADAGADCWGGMALWKFRPWALVLQRRLG